jgi:hypothetical protein
VGKKSAETKARLEAKRREQKRQELRRALLIYVPTGAVALAVIVGIVIYTVLDHRAKSAQHKVGHVAAATSAAAAAGCTGVVNDAQQGRTHVGRTQKVDYTQAPPSSGNHDEDPLPAAIRFYNPRSGIRTERAVHNLEHGFVVGWYDAQLPTAQVDALRQAADAAGDRFIAVPWTRSTFPDGRHFVLTAWDRTQRCTTVSPAAVTDFVRRYGDPGDAGKGWKSPTAPESGAAGGTPNVTADGPITGAGAAVSPGSGTMTVPPVPSGAPAR